MFVKKLIAVLAAVSLLVGTMFCCFITATAQTADNLITGGEWVAGQYLPNSGAFDTTSQKESAYRIAYTQKISVTPGETYNFDVGSSSETLKLIIRGYDSNGACVAVTPATIVSGEITMPDNVVQVSVSVYDTRLSTSGPTAEEILGLVSDGSLNPTITAKAHEPEVDNLITGGEWIKGQYLAASWGASAGMLDTEDKDTHTPYRIAYTQKIGVTSGKTYNFDVGSSSETLKLIVRAYDSSNALVTITPATIVSGEITMPDNVVQIGITVYDTRTKSGPTAQELLALVNDGSLNPVISVVADEPSSEEPTEPSSEEPTEPSSEEPTEPSSDNLIAGGEWVAGQYLPNSGAFDTTSQKESAYRIAYTQKISVTPGKTYKFDVGSSSETLKLIIRGYDSNGACVAVTPATIVSGEITMPDNVVQVSISVYDTRLSTSGPTAEEILGLVNDGSLNPTITTDATEPSSEEPTEPSSEEPTEPSSEEPTIKYGDVNGDGDVNQLDLLLMRKYLAKWNVEIDNEASDCNVDGDVNLLDLLLMRKYLANWDIVLGPQK